GQGAGGGSASQRGRSASPDLLSQQMLDHHLVERLVVALGNELPGFGIVEAAGFHDQLQEGATAVVQVRNPMLDFGGAEGMNVETDVFTVFAVAVALECPHLVEGDAKIVAPKR